jgi:hypothetical protein
MCSSLFHGLRHTPSSKKLVPTAAVTSFNGRRCARLADCVATEVEVVRPRRGERDVASRLAPTAMLFPDRGDVTSTDTPRPSRASAGEARGLKVANEARESAVLL